MGETVSNFVLQRLTAWGIKRVYGYPDDGIMGAFDRLGDKLEFVQVRHEEMAGSFGFEKEHYDVSIKVGERVLLPAVREAAKETLIIADGFSCREQIAQATDRRALHLAQVLQLALHQEGEASA